MTTMIRKENLKTPLRWAQVGGGKGSQVGCFHRDAAHRDDNYKLVAGAFDIDAERGLRFGVDELGLDADRCYPDYKTMFDTEAKREDGIQVVSITTPNSTHYEIARSAIEHNLHVICEKPLTFTAEESLELKELAKQHNRVFGVTYGYSSYPTVAQAREMVQRGDIGKIRVIHMQFSHGFHAARVEDNDPGLQWRVTKKASGPTYVLGDCGTHPLQMARMITGLEIDKICCMRRSFVGTRELEDDGHVMVQYKGGAYGTLWASAVAVGHVHNQRIEIIGEKGTLQWWDEHPNQLMYAPINEPFRPLDRAMSYLYEEARFERIGAGHPEGLYDAWANMYRNMALAMAAADSDDQATKASIIYPNIDDAIEGVRFLEACAESADNESKWVTL
ncbi:scyllo-inositol 2-dehydrogenase (NAD(+)) [invertebrate metagenome]|uniref:Scyllo-inositol 2-dehydrogenase (NAD(+)) n=1 Tax=invertebrate metagenome TaxID=1711999 RepID=A0A2H9T6Z1_9ZZZZ